MHSTDTTLNENNPAATDLLLGLYRTASRHLVEMKAAIATRNLPQKGILMGKLTAILNLLQSTLKDELAPELSDKLRKLYLYFSDRLFEASINLTTEPVEEVIELWTGLQASWEKVIQQASEHNHFTN